MSDLEKIFQMNPKINKKVISLMAQARGKAKSPIADLREKQNRINRTIFEKLTLFCAHIIQKTELLSDDSMRENLKKQQFEKKAEDMKDEKRHLDFYISFFRE